MGSFHLHPEISPSPIRAVGVKAVEARLTWNVAIGWISTIGARRELFSHINKEQMVEWILKTWKVESSSATGQALREVFMDANKSVLEAFVLGIEFNRWSRERSLRN